MTANQRNCHNGFTLVELLVVIIIVALLSALTLAGLRTASGRSRVERTGFLITKLSDALFERYEEYEDLAYQDSILVLRERIINEMPDVWADVGTLSSNPIAKAYSRYKTERNPDTVYEDAECLYMVITQSGLFTDLVETLHASQIGDIDGDGAMEFLDGWNRPIGFFRWAPGYESARYSGNNTFELQKNDFDDDGNAVHRDIFIAHYPDSKFVSGSPVQGELHESNKKDFAMFPLIYSGGADMSLGLTVDSAGWLAKKPLNNICQYTSIGATSGAEADDNITNHDLFVE